MQQLWLNHKRIDSIAQLRTLLAAARQSEALSDELCLRLLEYANSGVLSAWLARQSESFDAGLDPEAEKLTGAIRILRSTDRDAAALHGALAELTGLPARSFAAEHVQKLYSGMHKEISEKLAQLESQTWWDKHRRTFAMIKPQDWSLVVLDNSQLQLALEYLRGDSTVQRTLYICNTDQMRKKWYALDLRGIENVTIAGIESPSVQYDWFAEEQEISVKKKKIYLQDLTIRFYRQVCLKDYQGFSTNFFVTVE